MASLNLPMPGNGIDIFAKNLMKDLLERKQFAFKNSEQERLKKQFEEEMALKKQQESRMGANSDLIRKNLEQTLLEHKLKTDPKALFEFVQAIKNQGQATGQQTQGNESQPQQTMQPINGTGMPSINEMQNTNGQVNNQQPLDISLNPGQNPTQQPTNESSGLLGNLTPDQQMMLSMAGIKVPTIKENPADKRLAALHDKIQLEGFKTEQKKAIEQEKSNLKNNALRNKTIEAAKNDIPHLESTLKALQKMKIIAEKNPDLFGHNGIFGFGSQGNAERFAKTTDNPNAGAWQVYGLNPIVAAELKMSSRGNQLALKQALANKPNFEEKQSVALSKIKANIKQIEDSIKENKKLTGETEEQSFALMTDPNGETWKVPEKDVALRVKEKWHHVK